VAYALVFLVALAVGAGVYVVSLRRAPFVEGGFGSEATAAPPPEPALLPVATNRPDWQTRLTGVLGLLIAVTVGAVALTLALVAFGSLIARLFGSVSGGDSGV
jgi:hypothetical protein